MMPGAGMNMNGGPMMGQMMNMGPMMNQMMEMGGGMGDMGMMPDGGAQGPGGQGTPEGQVQVGMMGVGVNVGEGFGPGGAPGQGMMGMGMNPEFAMQVRGCRSQSLPLRRRLGRKVDVRVVQDPTAMGQQMYPGMEGSGTPGPVAPTPTRGVAQGQFRGRGMSQGMRGRGAVFAGRGRGSSFVSVS